MYCLGCERTYNGHIFLHQDTHVLINSVDTVLGGLPLQTINNIEIPAHFIVTIPTKKIGTCALNTPCTCEMQVNEILVTQKA